MSNFDKKIHITEEGTVKETEEDEDGVKINNGEDPFLSAENTNDYHRRPIQSQQMTRQEKRTLKLKEAYSTVQLTNNEKTTTQTQDTMSHGTVEKTQSHGRVWEHPLIGTGPGTVRNMKNKAGMGKKMERTLSHKNFKKKISMVKKRSLMLIYKD